MSNKLIEWCEEFGDLVPLEENTTAKGETFHTLQGVAYVIDRMVNEGLKDLLGVGADKPVEQGNESKWCNLDELCRRHPELVKSKVVSRRWRLEHNFPSKGGYKCRQMYYEPDVIEWIKRHLMGKC